MKTEALPYPSRFRGAVGRAFRREKTMHVELKYCSV
jgi:hypothetical protein